MSDDDKQDIYDKFHRDVNMTKRELAKWLASDEAQSVGIKKGTSSDKKTDTSGGESTGHEMGRHIVEILNTKKADLSNDQYQQMKKASGYVARHSKQRPQKEAVKTSRWRYSLMNWGNDPLKK